MAEPILKKGTELLIYREGSTPSTYEFLCGITTKNANFGRNLAETVVQDCDNPSAIPWTKRTPTSRTAQLSGSGSMAMEKRAAIQADFDSDNPRNLRLVIKGVGYWSGAWQLASFQPGAQENDPYITISVEWQSDGAITWTDDLTAGV